MNPHLCPENFKPAAKIYQMAADYSIPSDFINSQVNEFVLHWRDKGTLRNGWQRSFWNWCKQGWSWKMKDEMQQGVKQPKMKRARRAQPKFIKQKEPVKVADVETGKSHLNEIRKKLEQLKGG